MPVLPVSILGLYVLVGLIHEISALRFWEKLRLFTKAALMPVLLIFYIFSSVNFNPVTKIGIMAVIAIAFSWIGDIFLIRKDEPKFFRLGLVAFLISHVFYFVTLVLMIQSPPRMVALIISIIIALGAEILLPIIIKPSKAMRIPVIVYGIVLLSMSVCAFQYMLLNLTVASVLLFTGSVIFIFSDSLMTYFAFGKKPKYFNAITMLPYIIAQGLIVFGLAF